MIRKRREPLRSPASSNGDCADARIMIDAANAHVAAGALDKDPAAVARASEATPRNGGNNFPHSIRPAPLPGSLRSPGLQGYGFIVVDRANVVDRRREQSMTIFCSPYPY
ncbi:hypothetical protein IVB22_18540 [Bradyrhizobium sp. 190]|uniref:hypothetical protein n=1 Tax=Bradyrhizobium sp. 190 TaxID=2782658 RepID=UPI001FF95E75|nr:hypothetical protein [Bradyrhizobium sp. 190]MCK1514529.1 hypothetical protein [Bradyrhizobium sp. 190]